MILDTDIAPDTDCLLNLLKSDRDTKLVESKRKTEEDYQAL